MVLFFFVYLMLSWLLVNVQATKIKLRAAVIFVGMD